MSTTQKKKALLEKLKRQKEKQKKNVFTIPKIKPSTQQKKSRTFIQTTSTMLKKSTSEVKMRKFLASVNSLTDENLQFDPTNKEFKFNDPTIEKGYNEFVKHKLLEALQIDSDADRQLIKIKVKFYGVNYQQVKK